VRAHCCLELAHLVPLGLAVSRLKVEDKRQLAVYHDVVTPACPRQLETKGVGQAEQVLEPDVEVAAFDPPTSCAASLTYLNLETATSLDVMNSRSAGWPASVAAMPRLIAGTISAGSVTRSP